MKKTCWVLGIVIFAYLVEQGQKNYVKAHQLLEKSLPAVQLKHTQARACLTLQHSKQAPDQIKLQQHCATQQQQG